MRSTHGVNCTGSCSCSWKVYVKDGIITWEAQHIVMGAVYQATNTYAIGLMLLSDVALAGLIYTAWRFTGGNDAQAPRGSVRCRRRTSAVGRERG